jgi:hypothetical protein
MAKVGGNMREKTLGDIERLNMFDYLRAFQGNIRSIYRKRGTAYTTTYILRKYKVKLKGWELRKFLGNEEELKQGLQAVIGYRTNNFI